MKPSWLGIAWLLGAALLAIGTTVGGDTSIVAGFVWLAWTAPIGLIWQFVIYDHVLKVMPAGAANGVGLVLVLIAAYAFWFLGMPAASRAARRKP